MIAKRQDDRAVHRVEVLGDLFLQIRDEKSKFHGDAMDISGNGINFLSLRRIPLFREVDVHLRLPMEDHRTGNKVHCHGVVVRCVTRVAPFFEIALFFMDLASSDRHKIQRYMTQVVGAKPLGPR